VAQKKRIAIFLDGTWNSVETNTNIWRLRSLCAEEDGAGLRQVAYYDAGVGTREGQKVRGGAFGYGLNKNVVDAYHWLIENYSDGDHVFVFGFSRGAFTARSLTGLIAKCGLLRPGAPLSVEQLFERYEKGAELRPIFKLDYDQRHGCTNFTLEEKWVLKYSLRIPIDFIGVFDTVGSLGVPFGNIPGISSKRFLFHNTRLSNIYRNSYQALAIDEHRKAFEPTLWTKFTPKIPDPPHALHEEPRVEQRWFVGAHGNVGGGYRNDRLPQLPLAWLVDKAKQLGLTFRFEMRLDGDEQMDAIADSYAEFLYGAYKLVTLGSGYLRPIGRPTIDVDKGLVDTVNETIDGSVFDRWQRDPNYRPANLETWATGRNVDPSAIKNSVSAATVQPVP
jgi:uncharacterized protein (DUF2235 family)